MEKHCARANHVCIEPSAFVFFVKSHLQQYEQSAFLITSTLNLGYYINKMLSQYFYPLESFGLRLYSKNIKNRILNLNYHKHIRKTN